MEVTKFLPKFNPQKGITAGTRLIDGYLARQSSGMLKAGKYNMGENTGFPFDNTTGSVGELGDLVIPVDLSANVKQLHEFLYNDTDYTPSVKVQDISNTIRNNTGV